MPRATRAARLPRHLAELLSLAGRHPPCRGSSRRGQAEPVPGPCPEAIGGLTVVEVPSREEALQWAAKIAAACRCAQEVREFGPDPELDEMLRQADR